MISPEKQFEFITRQIAANTTRMYDAFKLFVQLFSAIVGGSVWLSIQHASAANAYANILNVLAFLVTVIAALTVIVNLSSWYRYREAQSLLTADAPSPELRAPPPRFWPSAVVQIGQVLCMLAACILFWIFNPLAHS